MTQILLQEKAIETFVKNVNIVELINTLEYRKDYLAKWVVRILDLHIEGNEKLSYIIRSLFDRTRLEQGETIAYANTSMFFDDVDCGDPFGEVLEVSECKGHVFIRYTIMDKPITSFEISMYDNSRDE